MDLSSVGDQPVSPLLLGSNPFRCSSHQGTDRGERRVHYHTVARAKETLFEAERLGITGLMAILMFFGYVSAAGDPFEGTWVLNLSKSKLPPPIPKSQIAHVVVDSSGIQITEELVTGAGERMTISVKARFDGKDYPISGSPFADAVAYQRVDQNTIKGVGKKDGKVIMHETVVLSPDGKTMTGTYSGTDPTGKQVTAVAIFEKQQ